MKIAFAFALLFFTLDLLAGDYTKSLTYHEVINKYKELDSLYEEGKMIKYGRTDCGENLYLFVISKEGIHHPDRLHELGKCILFINNGIHAGEPDGIDASVALATNLLANPLYKRMLENAAVCIVPVFNIDGALMRSMYYRVNQNGPAECGFRANSKNYDLNRDFIKTDAQNTYSLVTMLRQWDPDVFIDTHVSDGADYQYTMTLIASQHNKLNPSIGSYLLNTLTPALYKKMKVKKDEIIPYVQTVERHETPDSGIAAFLETPRYLGGYASLFNCFSFISESHMLKPFEQRLASTTNLLESLLEICNEQSEKILSARKEAKQNDLTLQSYSFNYKLNKKSTTSIEFKGYTAIYKTSLVTGMKRLHYDRNLPYTKKIPFYNEYLPSDSMKIPKGFIIPQAYPEIIRLLKLNNVLITRNETDSVTNCEALYITDYKTVSEPYEGRYLHYNVKTRSEKQRIRIKSGDYLVPLPQETIRYILETLNPRAFDSFFCWGFFDSFLQQKEWFSPYLFEETAEELLKTDEKLKNEFEAWKLLNKDADDFAMLNFIYQNSPYMENSFRRYPIFSY
jgi:hypothetical protein